MTTGFTQITSVLITSTPTTQVETIVAMIETTKKSPTDNAVISFHVFSLTNNATNETVMKKLIAKTQRNRNG